MTSHINKIKLFNIKNIMENIFGIFLRILIWPSTIGKVQGDYWTINYDNLVWLKNRLTKLADVINIAHTKILLWKVLKKI